MTLYLPVYITIQVPARYTCTMVMSLITIHVFNLLQTSTKLEYVMLMFQMLETSSMIVSCKINSLP